MLTTSQLGNLGEAKAVTRFVEEGFDVFTQFSGNNPFDFIVHKEGMLYKVEVKTTTKKSKRGSYLIYLGGTSYGHNRTIKYKPLDTENIDLLVAYIQPIDTLCFFNTDELVGMRGVSVREERTSHSQRLISDYKDIKI